MFLLKGVLSTLFSTSPTNQFILFSTPFNQGLFEETPDNVRKMTLPEEMYFDQLDRFCAEENIDVLFRSYPMLDELAFPLGKQIFFMPDLQHEFFPGFFSPPDLRYRRLSFNRGLALAGGIATCSEYTKGTITEHEWNRCLNIAVVSPAGPAVNYDDDFTELTEDEKKLIPAGDFFFYPANLWQHKNHKRVLAAFAHFLKSSDQNLEFVFTGHPEGWKDISREYSHLPIRHLGFVSEPLLRQLYQKARALVFFSLYEGFGMPLLEAFSAGTPVICSNTTSLPEVGGDAVLACDPTDANAMAKAMSRILQDADLVKRLVDKGRKQLSRFTWERSAHNLLNACKLISAEPISHAPDWEPLVSIVTPSYNQGRFLKRTIDSVLSQTYPKVEYIVIDGNSSDNSIGILNSYQGTFRWVSEPDEGQTHAINKGFAMARGEILCYLNSDDTLMPDAIEKVVDYFRNHPESDMVYGKAIYIDTDDKKTGTYNTDDYSFERLMFDCCVCQPAAFWRKRIARKAGDFDQQLNYVMDYDYWLRIDRIGGNIQHMPDLLAASRLYPETKTLSSRREIYREIFKICLKHGGYVDRNFFFGLWHHLTHENETGWLGKSAWLKKNYAKLVSLHYYAFHLYHNPRKIRVPALLKAILK